MKLLFVTEFFPINDDLQFTGGVEAYNYYLIRELTKRHTVTVLCRKLTNQKDHHNNPNLKVIRLGTPPKRIDTGFSTLFQRGLFQIEGLSVGLKQDFDLVQGNNFVTYILAFLIGLFKNKPKIAWYPDVFIDRWISLTGLLSGIVGEITERLSLLLPWNHLIALSHSTKEKLLKNGIKKQNITVSYAGVDSGYIESVDAKTQENTICCVSRFVSYKHLDMVISAIHNLKQKNIILKATLIGDGPEKQSLLQMIKDWKLEDQITIRSQLDREELIRQIKSAQLFIHPSTEEGFGMVIVEAAAANVPYIASDIPVIAEITHNGLGGMLFKPLDQNDLEIKIEQFFNDQKLRLKLKNETKKLAEYYSWPKIAQEFEEVYVRVQR